MSKKKKTIKKKVVKEKKQQVKSLWPDSLSLALYLIAFILVVFGAWYHKINWILMAFVPFLVAIWYEYMKKNL
jgi:hypothetical protein